jgi:hypothetical protein
VHQQVRRPEPLQQGLLPPALRRVPRRVPRRQVQQQVQRPERLRVQLRWASC